jgi:TM2 domain-containing membrane protein YozV
MGYFLWLFLGLFGIHRFYLGKRISGTVYLLTLGVLGLSWLANAGLVPMLGGVGLGWLAHAGLLPALAVVGLVWLVDAAFVPGMRYGIARRYQAGTYGYTTGWLLLLSPFGLLGAHRYYVGDWKTGLLYSLTAGCLGFGVLYDFYRMNELLSDANERWISGGAEERMERPRLAIQG